MGGPEISLFASASEDLAPLLSIFIFNSINLPFHCSSWARISCLTLPTEISTDSPSSVTIPRITWSWLKFNSLALVGDRRKIPSEGWSGTGTLKYLLMFSGPFKISSLNSGFTHSCIYGNRTQLSLDWFMLLMVGEFISNSSSIISFASGTRRLTPASI